MTGVTGVVLTYCGIAMPFDDAIQELPKDLPHRYPGGAHTRRTGGAIVLSTPLHRESSSKPHVPPHPVAKNVVDESRQAEAVCNRKGLD